MAACGNCGRNVSTFESLRGMKVHEGKCKIRVSVPQLPAQLHEQGVAGDVSPTPDDVRSIGSMPISQEEREEISDMQVTPDDSLFATPTDKFIARMFEKYPGMSKSILDDCIKATQLGPCSAASANDMMKTIDKLPGTLLCLCKCNVKQELNSCPPIPHLSTRRTPFTIEIFRSPLL